MIPLIAVRFHDGLENEGTMGDGLQFIDIIFLAMVAVFLVLRLRSVLGRRTGEERPRPGLFTPEPREAAEGHDVRETAEAEPAPDALGRIERRRMAAGLRAPETGPVAETLASIQAADSSFGTTIFLEGARAAFEMIINAFTAGDRDSLRPLLAEEVFQDFSQAIDARAQAGRTSELQLMGPPNVEVVDAVLAGRQATITVRFISEQVNVVRDADDKVVEGDPNRVNKVVDVWSFARDLRSRDPNWMLVATRSTE